MALDYILPVLYRDVVLYSPPQTEVFSETLLWSQGGAIDGQEVSMLQQCSLPHMVRNLWMSKNLPQFARPNLRVHGLVNRQHPQRTLEVHWPAVRCDG
jgi:hypothetical protein